ncbi:MAG TPA: chromate transporter [Chloroflexia bacterium]|nr:chromate transporter [Chloroflexia bacterium]
MNPLLYFLVFLKASLFSTGGLGNLPSLHQDLLDYGWAQDADFAKAVAVGQVTPGPNGLWVISLGFITYGFMGVVLALVAIIIPPFSVLALAAVYRKIEHHRSVRGVMKGLSLAVVGSVVVVAGALTVGAITDWRSAIIGLGAFILAMSHRVHVIFILLLAALAGLLFFPF